jgi:NADH:ubiquinone oxidoreductase subunit D
MEFYERISGARMHTAFYRPVLKSKVLNQDLTQDILDFTQNCLITLNEIHNVLTNNKV